MSLSSQENPFGDRERILIDRAMREAEALESATTKSPAPDDADQLLQESLAEHLPGYRVVRELHRGGQGVVYQALHVATKRKVAIKVMREGPFAGRRDRVRFEREMQILGQLSHPGIVAIHDSGTAAGSHYYVMDYVAGEPLDGRMGRNRRTITDTLKLFAAVCEAVNAAHLQGVVHRDLKPSNIRVSADGSPHVLDFGLAKVATGQFTDQTQPDVMTETGQFVGSLPWASPEQVEGFTGLIDVRTDVYSLGVVLYQLLTGKFPYSVIGPLHEVMETIRLTEPARPDSIRKDIDDEVSTIVLKCLSKDRARRYQNAGEVARDIRHYLAGEPIEAKRDSSWYLMRKAIRRNRGPVALAGTFVAVVIVFGVVMFAMYQRAERAYQRATQAEQDTLRTNRTLSGMAQLLEFMDPEYAPERDRLDAFVARLDTDPPASPEVEAEARVKVGNIYRQWDRYADAQAQYEQAMTIQTEVFGAEDASIGDTYQEIGRLYHRWGQYDESLAAFRSGLEVRQAALGDEDIRVAESMNGVATSLDNLNRNAEAEPMHREVLARRLAHYGPDHPEVSTSRNNLGVCLFYLGRYAEAEQQFRIALEMDERLRGPKHPRTMRTLNNLAVCVDRQGKPEAEDLHRRVLGLKRENLARTDPSLARSIQNFAQFMFNLDRFEQAEELAREALGIREQLVPKGNRSTAMSRTLVARCLLAQDRAAEAEPLLRRSWAELQAAGESQGESARNTLEALIELSETLDRPDEADSFRAILATLPE